LFSSNEKYIARRNWGKVPSYIFSYLKGENAMSQVFLRRFKGIRSNGAPNCDSTFVDVSSILAIGPKRHVPAADVYVASVRLSGSAKEETVILYTTSYSKSSKRYYNLIEEIESTGAKLVPLESSKGEYLFKQSDVKRIAPAGRILRRDQTRVTFADGNRSVYPVHPQKVIKSLFPNLSHPGVTG
jgi:hypothetical protein